MTDAVNNPPHYRGAKWECIDIIRAYNLDFWRGNALKYIVRHTQKGGAQDIAKAMWYLRDALAHEEIIIALSYNIVNDNKFVAETNAAMIAKNFGIEDATLHVAIDAIISIAAVAVGRKDVEDSLSDALAALNQYLRGQQ